MILLIDNYDSFTYNLVQSFSELGASVTVRRNDEITIDEIGLMAPDHLVISPGPCTPFEAGTSIEVVRAFTGIRPILGVCLGHQAIGAAFGADIVRAPSIMHGKTSEIHHDGKGIFAGLANPILATRYHSLVVDEESMPDDLEVIARSEDGLMMAMRHREHAVYGVQFHPESILTEGGQRLLANFMDGKLPAIPAHAY